MPLASYSQQEKKRVLDKSFFLKTQKVDLQCLHKGLLVENYRIGKKSDTATSISVAFQLSGGDSWIELAEYQNDIDAEVAVMLHVAFFKQINIGSEGIHLVEHILLRPNKDESRYGLFLSDEKGRHLLASTTTFTFDERKTLENKLGKYLQKRENYSVEINDERDFEIHLNIAEEKLTFKAIEPNISVEKAHKELEDLISFMRDENIKVPFANKIDYFVQNSPSSPKIPEEFLSQRMSVFLPDWTARFSDEEFRSLAEEVIYQHQPANVAIKINWLGHEQMQEFERLYFSWCSGKANQKPEGEIVDGLSTFLFKAYQHPND